MWAPNRLLHNVLGDSRMHVIGFILFGLVVGVIARALMPGRQPMGFILTAILGMAGSFLGSWIGGLIQGQGDAMEATDPYNWIGAVLGYTAAAVPLRNVRQPPDHGVAVDRTNNRS